MRPSTLGEVVLEVTLTFVVVLVCALATCVAVSVLLTGVTLGWLWGLPLRTWRRLRA